MGATAALALQGASTITNVVGQRRQADAAIAQGEYQAGIATTNAGLADASAADAVARGREAELRRAADTRRTIGAQRAAMAAGGIDLGTGSAADVQADAAYTGALDQLTIRTNAAREAFGYQTEAANDRVRATNARTAGRNTATGLRNQAGSTLLTGALSLYNTGKELGKWGQSDTTPKKRPSLTGSA